MTHSNVRKAGEVVINSIDMLSEFERTCVLILRHANYLYETDLSSEIPKNIKNLFTNRFGKYLITDLITIFSTYYLRPIVRHQPNCMCVGADENVFANILRFSLDDQENEVKILGSLLIKPSQLENLVKKAKVVAFLIDEDLKKTLLEPKSTQTFYNYLH